MRVLAILAGQNDWLYNILREIGIDQLSQVVIIEF